MAELSAVPEAGEVGDSRGLRRRDQGASGREVLIDVREGDEYNEGYIPGATWIPRGKLELRIEDAVPEPRRATSCSTARAATARRWRPSRCSELGYTQACSSMAGGFGAWKKAGLPTTKPFILTQEQKSRYARHLMLPEVGEDGQAKLLQSKVLLLGAGGLGAPAGALPGGGGRRHARARRRRRGRRVEPAAAGHPRDQARRHAQGRVGGADRSASSTPT